MEDNFEIQKTADNHLWREGYNKLGKKVFWLFFLKNSPWGAVLLLVLMVFFILDFQNFTNTILGNIHTLLLWATLIVFTLFLIVSAATYIFAWLVYSNYAFMLDNDSFRIRRGVFNKIENAIPYRQIQNVDIERSFAFQVLGLSRLIILTAGHEDEKSTGDESEGVIPAIDKNIAESLQSELLKRAEIQKMIDTGEKR